MSKHTITMSDESLAQFLDEQTDEIIDLKQENSDLRTAVDALVRENMELKSMLALSEAIRTMDRGSLDVEGE